MQTIAVIILNWNGWQATLACLGSLLRLQGLVEFRVALIICDNGSDDDSIARISAWVDTYYPSISTNYQISLTLLQNEHNCGYSGGMNAAIDYALGYLDPDFLWLLNNDTLVAADSLHQLLICAKYQPNVALWGSTVCEYNTQLVKSAGGCRYNPWLTHYQSIGAGCTLAEVQTWHLDPYLDYVDGAAVFMRREVVDTIGLLNEDYFLYFEELDYAYRVRKHGWTLGWCRKSIVYHQGGVSVQKAAAAATSNPRRTPSYHADFSAFKFIWNRYRNIWWIAMAARISGRIIKIAVANDWFLLRSLWCAYWDFWPWRESRYGAEGYKNAIPSITPISATKSLVTQTPLNINHHQAKIVVFALNSVNPLQEYP